MCPYACPDAYPIRRLIPRTMSPNAAGHPLFELWVHHDGKSAYLLSHPRSTPGIGSGTWKQNFPPPWKPRWSLSPDSHKKSSTRSLTTSPPIQSPSNHALSYPDRVLHRPGGTSSTPSSSPRGIWSDGSRRSRHRRRVPPITSGTYVSRSEEMTTFPRGFSNTPRGLRTWKGRLCRRTRVFNPCGYLRF